MPYRAWVLGSLLAMGAAACATAIEEDDPGSGRDVPPGATPRGDDDPPVAPQATCTMQSDVSSSFEERRLVNRLPGKSVPFAVELLEGTGFAHFEPDFAAELCSGGKAGASTFDDAKVLVAGAGARLWRAAVDRVQGRASSGTLPAGDDRMLYWARLTMTKTLRAWAPSFALSDSQRADLEWELERASRGQYDLGAPSGDGYVRIVVSGFDPFTLGAPGATDDVNVRIGNPSGAAALAFDGVEFALPSGKTAHIEAFLLPVNYGPFERGMEEDTLGPLLRPSTARFHVAITMSQGSGYRFKLEEYNGRFHGPFEGNDGVATCATPLPSVEGCNIHPPERWLGFASRPWRAHEPPQWVESTLPIAAMIAANTGAFVARPPDSLASPGNAFDVVWGYDYALFADCEAGPIQSFYDPVSSTYPPPGNPAPPAPNSCAREGSGGDYLSNESAYRATLLRNLLGTSSPVGHVHVPVMTRFFAGNESAVTDAKFEAYRAAIVQQARLLVEAVAKSL